MRVVSDSVRVVPKRRRMALDPQKESVRRMSLLAGDHKEGEHRWGRSTLLARLAPRWLAELPPNVSKSDAKIYFVRLGAAIMGATLHLMLVLIYLYFDAPWMVITNIVSFALFVGGGALVRSGRHFAGIKVCVIEACVHAPLVTVLVGLNAGYLLFNFILAMGAALVYPKSERRERLLVEGWAFFSSIGLVFYMRDRMPMSTLSPMQTEIVFHFIAASTFLALVAFAHHFVSVSEEAESRVERELVRSEQLLLNVLPAAVAARLKESPGTIADSFDEVTVLFADIVGFTKLSSVSNSQEIVEMLNDVFSRFDRIAERHSLEKIKTIGDAYMVVGGVPLKTSDHATRITRMALEMVDAVRDYREQSQTSIDIRVGIHSGPVVAGVIGEKKFAYDLWGDTVNIASRMESHGTAGRVHMSETTWKLVEADFAGEERGTIEVKGRGPIRTWYVRGAA